MKIISIRRQPIANKKVPAQINIPNNHKSPNVCTDISFGTAKAAVSKNALKNLFKKITNFNYAEFMKAIKDKKELSRFKNTLKYDKKFPDNKIANVLEKAPIEDIRARKEFYTFSKYNDFLPEGISEDTRITILSKVKKENLNLTRRLYDDPYFPKDRIPSIIDEKDPALFRLKEDFYNRIRDRYDHPLYDNYAKMKPYMNDIAFIMQQTDREYLGLAQTLLANPTLHSGAVLRILHSSDLKDIKAVKQIYELANKHQYNWGTFKEPSYPLQEDVRVSSHLANDYIDRTDIIRNFVCYTTKDNIAKAVELCKSKNLTPQMVEKTLKATV